VSPVSPSGTHTSDRLSHLTAANLLKVSGLVSVAGFVAGVVGIGGGMLMGPMLLDLGVQPQVGLGGGGQGGYEGGFRGGYPGGFQDLGVQPRVGFRADLSVWFYGGH
jgi:hypothetical protein